MYFKDSENGNQQEQLRNFFSALSRPGADLPERQDVESFWSKCRLQKGILLIAATILIPLKQYSNKGNYCFGKEEKESRSTKLGCAWPPLMAVLVLGGADQHPGTVQGGKGRTGEDRQIKNTTPSKTSPATSVRKADQANKISNPADAKSNGSKL